MSEKEQATLPEKVKELADAQPKTDPIAQDKTISETMNLKQENDAFEKELLRKEELKARASLGGKADAGEPEKTLEEEANERSKAIIQKFGYK